MEEESPAAVRGVCFGFEVRSPLEFAFLRSGTGDPLHVMASDDHAPVVEHLLHVWERGPTQPFAAALHGTAEGRRFRVSLESRGAYHVDLDGPAVTVPISTADDAIRREERLWGIPALLCFAARHDLPLHAAAVELDGQAILLAGASHSGKTTLAAAAASVGFRVLSEDLTCLRVGDQPVAIPGPAMLRLRSDVARVLPVHGTTVVARSDGRVHLAFDHSRRGDGRPIPIRAVVLLREGAGPPRCRRVAPAEALRELWGMSFRLGGRSEKERSFVGLARLVRRLPVWELHRRLRFGDLADAVEEVATCGSTS